MQLAKRIKHAERLAIQIGAGVSFEMARDKQVAEWRVAGDRRAGLFDIGQMLALPSLHDDEPSRVIWLEISEADAKL